MFHEKRDTEPSVSPNNSLTFRLLRDSKETIAEIPPKGSSVS